MRYLIIVLSLFLITCGGGGGGGSAPTEPTDPTYVVNIVSLGGAAQKGPFNNGTIINIAELNNSLSPTGKNFTSQIVDNSGTFSVANVQMEFLYAEIRASGFYFDEVGNQVSSAQLVLLGLSNLAGKTNMNVNVLSHLELNRIKNLLTGTTPPTFNQAKLQAQEEVLAIFDYSRSGVAESELLDITQAGSGNAKLLAISAILQDQRSVGELSELLANISTDITTDGVLDNTSITQSLLQSAYNLDLETIRTNLEARYTALGLTVTIPDFETEVNNFYKPPTVNDMSISTDEDTAINITLDGSDPENESLTYSTVEVNNATVTISGNVANYVPTVNWNGTDTFTYMANDGSFNSNTATVTVTVGGVDDDPNTHDISTSTDEDVSVVMNLTADEYDGENYSFSIISNPSNGTATLSGTQVTYTPNQDWHGTDTFTFEATDDRTARTNVATATIVVNPVNDVPIANDVTTSTDENLFSRTKGHMNITYDADNDILFNDDIKGTSSFSNSNSVDITLDGTDVDGDNLTYSVVATNNGTVTISGSTATYEPTQDWNGTDTFTYKVNDGTVDSNTATVTITVNAVNDAPVTNDIPSAQDEDTSEVVDLSTQTTDIEGDALTYSIVSDVSNGTTSLSGSVVTYIPNQDWNGTDSYTYKANDGTVDSNISTVTLTVNAVNDAAVAEDKSVSMDEDWQGDGTQYYPMKLIASDIDNTSLTFSVVSNPTNGDLGNGFYTNAGSGANADSIAYKPNANWNGTDTFTYKVNDGTDDSNTATVTITVNAVNDAPTTTDIATTIDENRTARMVGITLQGSDVDGDALTYSVVTDASNGTTSISGATLTYTANQDWNGTETITYKANDGTVDSNTSTITIAVNAVNDAPVVPDASRSTNEDTVLTIGFDVHGTNDDNIQATDVDTNSETFSGTFSIVSSPANGTISASDGSSGGISHNGQIDWNGPASVSLNYTPTADWNGTDTFTYKFNDGTVDSNTGTVTITVAAVNDAPIAYDFNQTTEEDNAKTITLRQTSPGSNTGTNNEGGVYDPDIETDQDTPITFSLVSQPSNGTATLITNNDVTYTPNANFNGTDTFTYKGNDGTADSNTATVTVTVTAVNDAPTTNDVATTIDENRTARMVGITLDGSDVDGDSITYSLVTNPSNGTASISGAALTYTANQDWNGVETFTYKANDGTVDSNTSTITITVNAVNDTPVVTTQDGDNSKSLDFDGNDHVDMGTSAGVFTSAMTVQAWAKADALQSNKHIVSKGIDTNYNYRAYSLLPPYATEDFSGAKDNWVGSMVVGTEHQLTSSTPATLNAWAHLVMTYDGSNIKLYVNGTLEDTQAATGNIGGSQSASQKFLVGDHNTSKSQYNFDGSIDGVAIWNIALTASDISTLYNGGDGSSPAEMESSNLHGYWNFEDNANDLTSNNNDGSVNGATYVSDVPGTFGTSITASTNEDTAVNITLTATDVDGDNLIYSVVSNPSNGSVSISGATATYTPDSNWNGTDTFTYRANDGSLNSNTATVTVTVAAVNDAPVSSAVSASTNEDTAKAITLSATDVEGSSLTYSVVATNNGSVSISGATATYTPDSNWNGTDTFTYRANDGSLNSNTATVTVTVAAVNDAPVSSAVSASTSKNTAKAITLDGSDVDTGDTLTYSIVSDASNGSTSVSGSTVTYTPDNNWDGTDTFTYKANDGTADSNTSTVTVTVTAWANTKSLDFDGNDHVDMGTSAGVFTSAMTVQAWAKADALQSNKHIVSKGIDTNYTYRAYSLLGPYATEDFSGAKDNWNGSMVVGSQAGDYNLTSSTPATLNAWAHLVMTYDGSNIKFYVNGTLEDTQAATGNIGGSNSSNQKFLVGDHNTSKSQYNFDGSIDGVAIWDIALTASDVTTLYNSGDGEDPSAVENSNLQGYWNFEDNANDLTSNNNDGSVNGATYVSDVPAD